VKSHVTVVAIRAMTEEEDRRFMAAIDALLARWAQRHIGGRHTLGDIHVQQNRHQRVADRGVAPQQQ
jgi:hypothetical protein